MYLPNRRHHILVLPWNVLAPLHGPLVPKRQVQVYCHNEVWRGQDVWKAWLFPPAAEVKERRRSIMTDEASMHMHQVCWVPTRMVLCKRLRGD